MQDEELSESIKKSRAKTRAINIERYGKDFYRNIGRLGGLSQSVKGFASKTVGKDGLTGQERAKIAGAKGGKISKRGKSLKHKKQMEDYKKVIEMYAKKYGKKQ